MRILTVVPGLGFGGTERVAQNMAIAYRDCGNESAVLAIREGGPREEPLRRRGVGLFIGGPGPRAREALNEAAEWGPQIVHIHRPGGADAESANVLRYIKARAEGRVGILETSIFARVDYSADHNLIDVHAQISRWGLWKWRVWTRGQRPEPIGVLLPNLVNTDDFSPATPAQRQAFRAAHGIPMDAVVFGRIGSPGLVKWSPIIFDAFKRVGTTRPEAYLVLVGAPPEFKGRIAALPDSIRRRVINVPLIHGDANLRAAYSSFDVFLHAARIGESFGMVLCEAMLCGVPVVTLSTPAKDNGQIEVVGHERGGFVVTDVASMVDAMNRLADDAPLRRILAAQGAAWVRDQYSAAALGPRLNKLARMVTDAPSREALRATMEADPELTTSISTMQIRELMAASIGSASLMDRVLMGIVMTPWIYRTYYHLTRRTIAAKRGGRRAAPTVA